MGAAHPQSTVTGVIRSPRLLEGLGWGTMSQRGRAPLALHPGRPPACWGPALPCE